MLLDWSSYHGLPWGFSSPLAVLGTSQPPYLCEINHEYIYELPWAQQQRIHCQCRRCGFDPWVGKNPLEKEVATHSSISPIDRGAWQVTVHGVAKESDTI